MMNRSVLILEQQSWKGGAQQVLLNVLGALGKDFRPVVAFPGDGPFRDRLQDDGIETLTYPLGTYRPGKKSWGEMLAFAWRTVVCTLKLIQIILSRKICMVYINGPRCLPSGVMAARLTGRPTLFHLHNVLTRPAETLLVSWFAQRACKIIACSNAAAESLLKSRPGIKSRISILYNPAPELPLGKSVSTSRPHTPIELGVVGRITEGKGHHVLIDAISKLAPRIGKSIQLTIVGAPARQSSEDESYLVRLKAHAKSLELDKQIVWAGYQHDVEPFYQSMDVLAVPSVGTEGLPVVVLEAMQRGIPVIATNTGGISEIVQNEMNGLTVPSGDSEELAKALVRLQSNPALFERLSSGARATLNPRFSPELFSLAIRRVVLELCPPARTTQVLHRDAEVGK
ncbi:MAG TPA: glycosyltransferase family 4 protein [Terriglobia bacterium]|nr:glycosyltransferase family 4 protein [Terriglobia bacterium]